MINRRNDRKAENSDVRQELVLEKMEASCVEVSEILKALSHPQRLMIMGHLMAGAKSVSELTELCEISQSQLSQFLNRMRSEGLVDRTREGKNSFYQISDKRVFKLMKSIQQLFCHE